MRNHGIIATLAAAALILLAAPGSAAEPEWTRHPIFTDYEYRGPEPDPYEKRRELYLEYAADRDGDHYFGVLAAARLGRGNLSVTDESLDHQLDRINSRVDCADFSMIRIMRMVYFDREHGFLTDEQRSRTYDAVLGFKYWWDEPGTDEMISWTENHQILFHASEYLAGQFFPDRVFTNNGMTGRERMEHARPLIEQWIMRRARWGFSEWDSNVYYGEDLPAIINLADLVEDPELANLAAMAVDLMILDMAPDVYRGVYGSSHGRTYSRHITDNRNHGLKPAVGLFFGAGKLQSGTDMTAISMATGGYRPPEAALRIAADLSDELITLERHGIARHKIRDYGLDFKDPEDWPTLAGMGFYSQDEIIDTTVKVADMYDLWGAPFFRDARQFRDRYHGASVALFTVGMDLDSDRTLLGEVNKYTYRTPDYMLSTAQDYRPGEMGNQHHIWQATLTPDAVAFVTNPGSLVFRDRTPDYWGHNRFPRSVQHKNLHISIYNFTDRPAIAERELLLFTHAYFPKEAYDEVVERDGWIFGRAGPGYIALYSQNPGEWNAEGMWAHKDFVVPGMRNIWVCVMGREAVDRGFHEFVESILAARFEAEELSLVFDAPGLGTVEFGWTGPLKLDGREIPLDDYPRVSNQFARSEFDSGIYELEHGGYGLYLDFNTGERRITEPR